MAYRVGFEAGAACPGFVVVSCPCVARFTGARQGPTQRGGRDDGGADCGRSVFPVGSSCRCMEVLAGGRPFRGTGGPAPIRGGLGASCVRGRQSLPGGGGLGSGWWGDGRSGWCWAWPVPWGTAGRVAASCRQVVGPFFGPKFPGHKTGAHSRFPFCGLRFRGRFPAPPAASAGCRRRARGASGWQGRAARGLLRWSRRRWAAPRLRRRSWWSGRSFPRSRACRIACLVARRRRRPPKLLRVPRAGAGRAAGGRWPEVAGRRGGADPYGPGSPASCTGAAVPASGLLLPPRLRASPRGPVSLRWGDGARRWFGWAGAVPAARGGKKWDA